MDKLNAALLSTTVNGGLRTSRSLAKLMLDVLPFIDENKNAGAEEIEELNRRRREQIAKQLEKAKLLNQQESELIDKSEGSHKETKDDERSVATLSHSPSSPHAYYSLTSQCRPTDVCDLLGG